MLSVAAPAAGAVTAAHWCRFTLSVSLCIW